MPPKKASKTSQSQGESESGATLILPGIYLGPRSSASASGPFLTKNPQITHVLSIGSSPPESSTISGQASSSQSATKKQGKGKKEPIIGKAAKLLRDSTPTPRGEGGAIYHRLPLNDDPDADILPTVQQAMRIIDEALYGSPTHPVEDPPTLSNLQITDPAPEDAYPEDSIDFKTPSQGGPEHSNPPTIPVDTAPPPPLRGCILIHCSAAISRSPTILTAYLLLSQHHRLSLHNALGLIIRARPSVCPNPGFIRQLKGLEKTRFQAGDGGNGGPNTTQTPAQGTAEVKAADSLQGLSGDGRHRSQSTGSVEIPDELPRGRKERLRLFNHVDD